MFRAPTFTLLLSVAVIAALAMPRALRAADETIGLPELKIEATAEEQESWPEESPNMAPFKRSGMFGELIDDDEQAQTSLGTLNSQLMGLDDFRPGDFAAASGAATPRGFTAPRLRNGLNQSGFPEIIIGGRRDLLTGFLATFYGRTAPGGISNYISRRPAPKATGEFSSRVSTIDGLRIAGERNAPIIPKKLHYRLTGEARWREGPEDFARQYAATGGFMLRWAPTKKTVWLVEFEGAWTDVQPTGGIPLERSTRGAKLGAPHGALADFNTNGPGAYSVRASESLSVLVEHKFTDDFSWRGGGEVWRRDQREYLFSTGAFLLDEHVFDGVREPQFNARSQSAVGISFELDRLVRASFGPHRWVAGAFASRERADRDQRALPKEARDALPASMRTLDPAAPDFSIAPYSHETFSRVLANRNEGADYEGVFFTERMSFAGERLNTTFGVQNDWVRSSVDDLRVGASVPHATAAARKASYHAGAVWHVVPNRLAGFLNHSTAFQPARRVDARTGRIIGNESTAGVETGLRYVANEGKLAATWSAYRLWNQDITRTNPLYNDPVLDPDRKQAQYVSSGEERFTGMEFGVREKFSAAVTGLIKATWLDAITTSSPDLPEEVGRQLARLPRFTVGGSLRYQFQSTRLRGFDVSASGAWVGRHVAVYESAKRAQVNYGSYGVVDLTAGWSRVVKKRTHVVTVALRNVLDRDLVAAAGRTGGGRAFDAGYSLRF